MPKTILQMARDKAKRLKTNREEAGVNQTLAVAAINGGIRSAAWRTYMLQFVEQNPPGNPIDPTQLERLLGTDNTLGHAELDKHRAYLVSNAICGAGTTLTGTNTVGGIDNGLANAGVVDDDDTPPRTAWRRTNGRKPRGRRKG